MPACDTATATWDPSHICSLHHSSRQCRILNPLIQARDRALVLMDTSGFITTEPQWELPKLTYYCLCFPIQLHLSFYCFSNHIVPFAKRWEWLEGPLTDIPPECLSPPASRLLPCRPCPPASACLAFPQSSGSEARSTLLYILTLHSVFRGLFLSRNLFSEDLSGFHCPQPLEVQDHFEILPEVQGHSLATPVHILTVWASNPPTPAPYSALLILPVAGPAQVPPLLCPLLRSSPSGFCSPWFPAGPLSEFPRVCLCLSWLSCPVGSCCERTQASAGREYVHVEWRLVLVRSYVGTLLFPCAKSGAWRLSG